MILGNASIVGSSETWHKRRIAVLRAESAFVYAIFESHEGLVSYSTIREEQAPSGRWCILELLVTGSMAERLEKVLDGLPVRKLD